MECTNTQKKGIIVMAAHGWMRASFDTTIYLFKYCARLTPRCARRASCYLYGQVSRMMHISAHATPIQLCARRAFYMDYTSMYIP